MGEGDKEDNTDKPDTENKNPTAQNKENGSDGIFVIVITVVLSAVLSAGAVSMITYKAKKNKK